MLRLIPSLKLYYFSGDGRDLLRLVPGLNSEYPSTQLQTPEGRLYYFYRSQNTELNCPFSYFFSLQKVIIIEFLVIKYIFTILKYGKVTGS